MTKEFLFRVAATLVCALVVIVAAHTINSYWLRVLSTGLNYACVALAWGFLLGYAGQLHFAPAAIWGTGGYISAILTSKYGFDVWNALLASGVVGAALGALLVPPAARLQKIYLGLFTLAFGELLRLVATNEDAITNGPSGLSLARVHFPFGMESVFQISMLTLTLLAVCYLALSWFAASSFGLRMQAIRDDQLAADARGVSVALSKLLAFSISSIVMAVAGGIYVFQTRYVSPDMLGMDYSFQFMVMGLFGGINTLVGPIVGALSIAFLLELLRSWETMRLVLLGILVCLNIIIMPAGLIGTPWRYMLSRRADRYLRGRFGTTKTSAADPSCVGED